MVRRALDRMSLPTVPPPICNAKWHWAAGQIGAANYAYFGILGFASSEQFSASLRNGLSYWESNSSEKKPDYNSITAGRLTVRQW